MELEELQKQNEELKSRLTKAGEVFKQQKTELETVTARVTALELENEKLKSSTVTVTSELKDLTYDNELNELRAKVSSLENELAINGDSSEEIQKLQERLNKAKAVFAEDKAIKEQLTSQLKETVAKLTEVTDMAEKSSNEVIELNKELDRLVKEKETLLYKIEELEAKLDETSKIAEKYANDNLELKNKEEKLSEQVKSYKDNIQKTKEMVAEELTDLKTRTMGLDNKLMSSFDIFA